MVRTGQVSGDFSDLPPQTAEFGPEFGHSVAISGDWLVVGAPGTVDTTGFGTAEYGAVFVFHREGGEWVPHQRLMRSNEGDPHCGHSVALHPPHLIVGCPDARSGADNPERGMIHFFRLNEDSGNFIFLASRYFGTGEEHCGRAVALTSNYLAVGCPTADDGVGRVAMFKRNAGTDTYNGGNDEGYIRGAVVDGVDTFEFGAALAMYEPPAIGVGPQNVRLAIGSPASIYAGNIFPRGTVHLYHRALNDPEWNDNAILRPSPAGTDGSALARFGGALAMNWNQLVVGAPNNRYGVIDTLPGPGTAHRFELENTVAQVYEWQSREMGGATNVPDGPHARMRYGDAIAIAHDSMIVVAAPGTDGEFAGGDAAEAVGLVEFRRTAGGDWSVFNHAGHVRPAPLSALVRDQGHFGQSLDTDVVRQRLAVGYPRSGGTLGMPGEPNRPRGSVWIYEGDLIFADGFQ
jgi:hypothetical protein